MNDDEDDFQDVPETPKQGMPVWAWLLICLAGLGVACTGVAAVSVLYWASEGPPASAAPAPVMPAR